ncbi:trimeric intracellular cation channel family protein [Methanoplanus endosymbiosus]|uniref:Trimeric intracellular cation channel family protein n=1 Tax=Methanoplanus endosymbiosus TaxID=33865 RepID=A0A9E7PTF3_9EURY|nr:trimeric intracellular cation channel family protein [Methanoplanus endosymbiosus]UUX93592.1 trimeric intracellular cation channel family protein [Methanoplanus endosymbiosus]
MPFEYITSNIILNVAGVAVFAITGVLAGSKKGMDIFGVVVVGVITALGGGTLRDIIIDAPVFWLDNVIYVWIAVFAAVVAFFMEDLLWRTHKPLLHLDAVGIAVFNIQAIDKTLLLGYGPTVAVIMGILTGITGGIVRDMLTDRTNLILRPELYATPIFTGGIIYVMLMIYTPDTFALNTVIGTLTVIVIRFAAIRWNLCYPEFLRVAAEKND